MPRKNRFLNSFLSVILIFSITLTNVRVAFADEGPTPEPAVTAEPTQPPVEATEPPVEATEPPAQPTVEPTQSSELPTEPAVVSTEVPTQAPAVEENPEPVEQAPIAELLSQAPENTDLVVLDENGQPLSLTSQEALDTILDTDPMWCPAGVLPGGAGCTTNFLTISALMTDMMNNTTTYDENGIIYFTTTPGASFSLTATSLGLADFNTLDDFNLTLQGGWNGSNGALATFTGQTNFAANTLTVGSLGNPWVGNITLNNFTFSGISSASAVTVYTTTGSITLDNVDVAQQTGSFNTALLNSTSGNITVQNGSVFDGNNSGPPTNGQSSGFSATTGSGSITISDATFQESRQNGSNTYDGATLSAPIVTLTNVIAQNNDGDGITINNANVVTLNNVTATDNGTDNGSTGLSNNDGSGVLVNGNAGSSVIINGGTFTGNQEYGVEVGNASNTTIYIQSNPTCTGNDSNAAPTSSCYNDTTIFDNTAPVITPSISGTAGSNGWYTSNVAVSWTVTDAESGVKTSTGCTASNLASETSGTTLTCSATNNAGLSGSNSVTVKIDKTGPTASLSIISGTLGSNGWYTSDVIIQTSGTDTISGPVTCTANQFQTTDTAGAVFNGSCTNNAGLATNASPLTIKVDKTGPITTLTVIAGTAGSNGWYRSDVTVQTTGTDSASNPVICTADQFQTTETAGTVFNGSCTNNAGLTTNATPLTIKLDKTNPAISFVNSTPAPNGNGWNNSDVTVNWSCTDTLSGPASPSVSQTISTEGANQSATGTCLDMAGNSAADTRSGFNIDKTNPTLNLPANMTVEATSSAGAIVNYSASASDNLDAAPILNCAPISGSLFVIGTTMVNCTATDHADNIGFGNFNITVQDTSGPVIEIHADITTEATSNLGAVVTYTSPAAFDAVDGPVSVSCSPSSGENYILGDTTVTCNAVDSKGNLATPTNFVIHVVDTTGPVIAPHSDIVVEATSSSGATVTYTNPTASDIVDGSVSVLCLPASGTTFALGNTTVTCNATDTSGNQAIATTFIVHVVDTTAPVIAAHADITAEATSAAGAVVTYSNPTATDSVDSSVSVFCSPVSGTTFALGNTTVTCNATDANGNQAIATTFVVHVVDTTAPVIGPHADVFVAATSPAGALVNYTNPTATDTVDGSVSVTCSPASGTQFALGDTTVTCNATDKNGNQATTTSFIVHVIDTAAPVIDGHLDETVEATSAAGATATYSSPATSDAVDGGGIATCTPTSGTFFAFGSTTVTCNATDSNGNDATPTTFVVHVVDTTAPIIAVHGDVTAEATSSSGTAVNYSSPATSDAVDGSGVASCSPTSGATFALGTTTVTCNAADANNNISTPSTFVVHVVDTTAPVIAAHADVAVTTNNTLGSIVTYSAPATSDAVDGPGTASCSPASGSFFPVGDTLVTCNETDAHGNAAQPVTFNVHVEYQAVVVTPTPVPSTPPTQGIDLSVPVTGALLDLDCLTIVDSFGIKITFHNLCDHQAAIADVQADTLPSPLPSEYSFVQGLNVLVLFEQQVVKDLPAGAGVQLDFPVPANTQDQFAVLLWDDQDGDGKGEWLDVTQLIKDQELSKVLSADPNDELYELVPTKTLETFYRVVTTEKTGTFVLVKK